MKPLLHWNESALESSFTPHYHFIEHSHKHSFEDIGISFIKSLEKKVLDKYQGFNHLIQDCFSQKRLKSSDLGFIWNLRDCETKNLKWRNFFGRVFVILLTIPKRGLCDCVCDVRSYSIKNQQCVKWIPSTTPTLNNCTTTKKKKCFWWSMQPFNVFYRISLPSFFVRRSRIKRYSFCWLLSSLQPELIQDWIQSLFNNFL